MRRLALAVLGAALASACGPSVDPGLTVLSTERTRALVDASLQFIPDARLTAQTVADPGRELAGRGGRVIAVVTRDDCTDCYRLAVDGGRVTVEGGVPLGVQYGLAHALEGFGYGFFHPWQTHLPAELPPTPALTAGQHAPAIARRGLHLHTLHPIEALYDFWIPGEANLEGAKRTIDFVIKNRGNHLQWVALDDITDDAATADAWRAHTRAITQEAHRRGLTTGIGVQLFGKSNLQNAFDLIDEGPLDPLPEVERRLRVLLEGTGFDLANLSFGEFFAADPADFVQRLNETYEAMQRVQPGLQVPCVIHVGNYADLRITYQGETLLYYFLVKFANPALVPWVHTTMFYNLYEDTGGAYLHDQFDEHRAYLEARLRAGQKVGYFPESAYWIAFDNSVPTYLPVYVKSRFVDLSRIAQVGTLDEHVLFSSGWEWGYWQTDAATLRMSYELPATWDAPLKDLFAVYGAPGAQVADRIRALGEVQHRALIVERLAPYLAGRDQLIDAGDKLGIFSQPDREEFSEVAALSPSDRAAFVTARLEPLQTFAGDLAALSAEVEALGLPDEPFLNEVQDGFAITAHRAAFIHALYRATVAFADTGSDGGWLDTAQAQLEAARGVVARRRRGLHDPDIKPILRNTPNPTFYQYGYLREADSLCFWERERAQARNLLRSEGLPVPGCVL